MKDTFYFTHDYNASSDEKIVKLLSKLGMPGYGIFWRIVEILYNNANALSLDYERIAYELHIENSEIVRSVIHDFGLFIIEGNEFGSASIERRLDERNEKSEKARQSAFKRWKKENPETKANANASGNDANASKNDAIKERKGNKGNKGNKPQEGEFIFFDSVISIFKEAWEKVNGIPYVVINEGKERIAARKFIEIYKKENPVTDDIELLEQLKPYFRDVCSIKDKWLKSRMDLITLVAKFNTINKSLNNNRGRGNSDSQLSTLPDKYEHFVKPAQTEKPKPPTRQEFIEFFVQNGRPVKAAEAAYENFETKQWSNRKGCIIDQWQSIVQEHCFKDGNKKH